MAKNNFLKVFVVISFSGFISCANGSSNGQENNNSVRTRTYSSKTEEAKALALPIDKVSSTSKKIKDRRAAAVILSNYVSIKDSLYVLEISKEDAQKLGVDTDLYMSVLQELKRTNKMIKEARQRGENITLPDVKEEHKKFMNSH
ncbi:hypothetical protein [Prevotella ihumii]|uniref:hypothetical protein n=1 Tax=Prevotella ihumii TaxID=1917878 RepID=UPI0009808B38|nr:hypothetical protein [Prevotella ihumii]